MIPVSANESTLKWPSEICDLYSAMHTVNIFCGSVSCYDVLGVKRSDDIKTIKKVRQNFPGINTTSCDLKLVIAVYWLRHTASFL